MHGRVARGKAKARAKVRLVEKEKVAKVPKVEREPKEHTKDRTLDRAGGEALPVLDGGRLITRLALPFAVP